MSQNRFRFEPKIFGRIPKVYENTYDSEPKIFGSTENLSVARRRCMKTQVMKAPGEPREEFKRGILRDPELINAEGEGGR